VTRPAWEKWLERSRYDLGTAVALVAAGRHIYVIFMCQQAIEKAFKAVLARQEKEVPPIHNLRRLAETAGLLETFPAEDVRRLDFLSQFYLNARYKEDIQELAKQVGEETARGFVQFTQEQVDRCSRELMR
jgi:HEPN domain-containing protein